MAGQTNGGRDGRLMERRGPRRHRRSDRRVAPPPNSSFDRVRSTFGVRPRGSRCRATSAVQRRGGGGAARGAGEAGRVGTVTVVAVWVGVGRMEGRGANVLGRAFHAPNASLVNFAGSGGAGDGLRSDKFHCRLDAAGAAL